MPVDDKRIKRIVEGENNRLASIHEGITEGILEGIKEGVVDGLKRGARDGLKECLAEGLSNTNPADIGDVLDGIGEDIVKATIGESTENIFRKVSETYIRKICNRVVDEVQKQRAELTEEQICYSIDLIIRSEKKAAKEVLEKLPANPFFREFAQHIQAALEENLEKELKLCEDRRRQKASANP